jgi:hypothetical protein
VIALIVCCPPRPCRLDAGAGPAKWCETGLVCGACGRIAQQCSRVMGGTMGLGGMLVMGQGMYWYFGDLPGV